MSEGSQEALWYVYVIRCRDATLYTGISTNVERRLIEHSKGDGKGAKYLRGRGPLSLAVSEAIGSRSQALKVESRFRKLSKPDKERCLAGGEGGLRSLMAR